ncbi:protein-L-isoaspartate O-methyltransferase [Sphingosinicella humi]|uniref:Protein-L-isoaspartate O-methyltransferase n=1 Tax=Allosphingosinicella humi TaxID=2068657 RepID=A0A2U2J628_9SPHN|nr:protein-L-isoaspartate O-methyltransferase [Sphingosinicella humi]
MLTALSLVAESSAQAESEKAYSEARARLVESIRGYARSMGEKADPQVLAAMRTVPRHRFVPDAQRSDAYRDRPLPIGEGQTISQPTIVAMMTHLLKPDPGDVMLEVGTGSGYQAAVLSRLVDHVYSIEIVEALARTSAKRLAALGYDNVTVRHGDGYAGWPQHGPFDGIIVTAGAKHVPPPLVEQLKPGGRMVIPVGRSLGTQELRLIVKDGKGRVTSRTITPVRFVPLTRNPD